MSRLGGVESQTVRHTVQAGAPSQRSGCARVWSGAPRPVSVRVLYRAGGAHRISLAPGAVGAARAVTSAVSRWVGDKRVLLAALRGGLPNRRECCARRGRAGGASLACRDAPPPAQSGQAQVHAQGRPHHAYAPAHTRRTRAAPPRGRRRTPTQPTRTDGGILRTPTAPPRPTTGRLRTLSGGRGGGARIKSMCISGRPWSGARPRAKPPKKPERRREGPRAVQAGVSLSQFLSPQQAGSARHLGTGSTRPGTQVC